MNLTVIQQFIIEKLHEIKNTIKGICLIYIYEDTIDYHTVLVDPSEIYFDNTEYKEMENRFVEAFYDKFPDQDILVSERVDHIEVKNVVVRLKSEMMYLRSYGNFTYGTPIQSQSNYDYSLAA